MKYCVLLRPCDLPEPAKLAPVLAAHLKTPFYEAARRVREAWGILGEDMEDADAKALSAALDAGGFPSVVLPANLLEELPAPTAVVSMDMEPDGLSLAAKSGEKSTLLWSRAALIAGACYKEVTVRKVKTVEGPSAIQKAASMGMMMAGIPIRIGPKKTETEKTVETSDLVFFLELYERKPLRRFRVNAQDFSYACLGEGMKYAASDNFRALVGRIASGAPRAALSRGSRVIVGNGPVSSMGYDSLASLERESRWLLTLESLADP